jgi:hypothetical protein
MTGPQVLVTSRSLPCRCAPPLCCVVFPCPSSCYPLDVHAALWDSLQRPAPQVPVHTRIITVPVGCQTLPVGVE